jgi:hypothetical protein
MSAPELDDMNDVQRGHIEYYLERLAHWGKDKERRWHAWSARLLAARDADERYPLRNEREASQVFEYLREVESRAFQE